MITDYYDLNSLDIPETMTFEEAAALLQISDQTIGRMIESDTLCTVDKSITRKDLLQYLIQQEAVNLPVDEMQQKYVIVDSSKPKKEAKKEPGQKEPELFDYL